MTDKLTAAQRADVLEMMAVHHGAPAHVLNQRAKDIRDEAARREAETPTRTDAMRQIAQEYGFGSRTPTLDALDLTKKPDAPPPPTLADLIDATLQHSFNLVERADVSDELLENLQARIAEAKAYILADVERHTEALRARAEAAEAREKALEGLLDKYRAGIVTHVQMNGPVFGGANSRQLKIAFEADQALAAGGGNG